MRSQSAAREGAAPGTLYFAEGGPDRVLDRAQASVLLDGLVEALGALRRVLLVPPDFTRRHSGAGELCSLLYEKLSARGVELEVLPALGTHGPMTAKEIATMFPNIPGERFRVHDFRRDLVTLGEVPASFVSEVSAGLVGYPIRCELSARLVAGGFDRIISVGQLVPHEVAGIAGHSKNVFIGTGGKDAIDRTHFLAAACGMEALMGQVDTPVRRVLSYMARELGSALPITYVLSVRERLASGAVVTRGLYAGDDERCFHAGAPLARSCNITRLERAPEKIVVFLDPAEFRSTWLGNKAIYRTRMAIATGGELLVIAPGVRSFGEDPDIDRLIRRHGYRGTAQVLAALARDSELSASLCAAAHLIHGSSEGRFRIRYAAGGLDAATLNSVGYESAALDTCLRRYDRARMTEGENLLPDGERVFFVGNPALGLWSVAGERETRS